MRILMTAGGTGGALAPLIAVADEVKRRSPKADILFLSTAVASEQALLDQAGYPWKKFPAGKWRRYADLQNIADIFVVIYAFLRALIFLPRYHPDVVVSAGSFLSVPIVWAARILGIRTLIHQQDLSVGLANRLMAPIASVITVAYEVTKERFRTRKHVLWTGNPVRFTISKVDPENARRRFGLSAGVPVLCVLGGSSGAAFLNNLIFRVAGELVPHCEIIHGTGANAQGTPPEFARYHRLEFFTDGIADLFAAADIVVTRAGLSTLSELGLLGKACIIIPMPDTHQVANAAYYQKQEAAHVLDQNKLDGETFVREVLELLQSPKERQRLSAKIHSLSRPDAASAVAVEIQKLATTK